ncbi:unnamed protein product [Peronospora belbahrii]|uniref:Uncharacterized protein n=1 Tax=Peronospora belbahrii TaxID=622444 RepID=A0AAU9LFV1_9STRA|nr:unnamed protein product [Peronospora belbahrii]
MRLGAPNLAKLRNMRQNQECKTAANERQFASSTASCSQSPTAESCDNNVVRAMYFSDDPGVPILEAIVDGKIVVASISTVRSSPRYKSFHDMCRCRKNGHLPQGSNPSKSELA